MTKLDPIEIDPKTFLHEHFTLPALPEVVSKIQNLTLSDKADVEKVSELISGEPALVAQILKVVNSAYYGLPREITKIKFAVSFMGLNETYRMILSLSVVNTLAIHEKGELNWFWFHSFFTALCTKYLAKKFRPHLLSDELWSAAILHDIGKLVYLKFFPDHYKTLRRYCKENGCLFSEAESHFSLPSSAFFGTLLCDHWRLPGHVRNACESHTLIDLSDIDKDFHSERFKQLVCLGNLLTILSTEELSDESNSEISSTAMVALDYTEPQFLTMMGDVYELRNDVEGFMSQFK
jgi:HD-like signal output (HDOD) protein